MRPSDPANTLPRSLGTAVPIGSSRFSCATADDGPIGKLRAVPVVPPARRADRPLERGLSRPACAERWQRKALPRRIPVVALHTVPRNPAQDGRRGDGTGPAAAPASTLRHPSQPTPYRWHGFTILPSRSGCLILHPKFKPNNDRYYDIGLIELSRPYSASLLAGLDLPRRSAEEEYAPSGTSSVVVGFGRLGNGGHTLHPNFVRENLYHAKDCRDRLNIFEEARTAHDDTICSGTPTRRANFGDSGGPLIVSYPVDAMPIGLIAPLKAQPPSFLHPIRTMTIPMRSPDSSVRLLHR